MHTISKLLLIMSAISSYSAIGGSYYRVKHDDHIKSLNF